MVLLMSGLDEYSGSKLWVRRYPWCRADSKGFERALGKLR